jgi:hypothetical protein
MPKHETLVRLTGYGLAAAFALVGLLFLAVPADVLAAGDRVGAAVGLSRSAAAGHSLYLILAVAYMYVVTVLATLMARHPGERAYATLLVHAKAASSLLSILLFAAHEQYFVYVANFAVDGAIALFVYWVCARPPARPVAGVRARRAASAGDAAGAV